MRESAKEKEPNKTQEEKEKEGGKEEMKERGEEGWMPTTPKSNARASGEVTGSLSQREF